MINFKGQPTLVFSWFLDLRGNLENVEKEVFEKLLELRLEKLVSPVKRSLAPRIYLANFC